MQNYPFLANADVRGHKDKLKDKLKNLTCINELPEWEVLQLCEDLDELAKEDCAAAASVHSDFEKNGQVWLRRPMLLHYYEHELLDNKNKPLLLELHSAALLAQSTQNPQDMQNVNDCCLPDLRKSSPKLHDEWVQQVRRDYNFNWATSPQGDKDDVPALGGPYDSTVFLSLIALVLSPRVSITAPAAAPWLPCPPLSLICSMDIPEVGGVP